MNGERSDRQPSRDDLERRAALRSIHDPAVPLVSGPPLVRDADLPGAPTSPPWVSPPERYGSPSTGHEASHSAR